MIPVLERVLAVTNDVVAVKDVLLPHGCGLVLVRESGVIDFPDPAAFDHVIARGSPELDRIAVAHGNTVGPGELMTTTDVAKIAVANDDMFCVPAAEAVGGAVHHGQTIVDDVLRIALIDHMPLHGALDVIVQGCRVCLGIQKDTVG